MKEIILSCGKRCFVDDADYGILAAYKWSLLGKRYAGTTLGFSHVLMHRMILNPGRFKEVDHIDGNGLNNQRANLRICSHSENMQNQRRINRKSSSECGVFFRKRSRKWHATIRINSKTIEKRFNTEQEAIDCRRDMVRTYYRVAQDVSVSTEDNNPDRKN